MDSGSKPRHEPRGVRLVLIFLSVAKNIRFQVHYIRFKMGREKKTSSALGFSFLNKAQKVL